jgi:hypothetical protein
VVILRTPGIFGITPEALTGIGIGAAAETLSRLLSFIPTLIILIVVVVTTIQVIKNLLRLLSGKSSSPYPVAR